MTPTAMALTIVAMGIVTYLIRLVPIALYSRLRMPVWFQQIMRYVPTAVLAALIAPEMLRPSGAFDLSLGNGRLLGGLVAIVVAWRTRNVLITMAAGMAVLWLVQALL